MNVQKIVEEYLIKNGFDGLFYDECGCKLGDLMHCGDICEEECQPGYLIDTPNFATGFDFTIVPEKPKT